MSNVVARYSGTGLWGIVNKAAQTIQETELVAVQHVRRRPTVKILYLVRGFQVLKTDKLSDVSNCEFTDSINILASRASRVVWVMYNITILFAFSAMELENISTITGFLRSRSTGRGGVGTYVGLAFR